ncbi:NAD(P)/FAD-dependent oxidoreductase [Parahaliea sp. F7430]|uniref:NAD(P)/FAD-dependent oxidoreductase n=1 Tax=Sediminihaliea albiluteola TaxID=2758564 RepID=A0A7W2YIC1_9GAMM|nr:NAD(P)/FAD-dependent oxidoreductase [Sediminihaliea albiluteola]MBA6411905.1 NAD(P)/FAD-dependent oxidoreductase [Sediminihaliea albiluteola]
MTDTTTERDLRVVVLGAGMAGILAGINLMKQGYRNIAIYEKADRVGGTWRENTYPGLTCDVPSHHYTYSFERNPDWTRHLPPGAEIQQYFERTAAKYAVNEIIQFKQEATAAKFKDGRWYLDFDSGHSDIADVLIAATGVLHKPSYPKIEGADSFTGDIFHSARWDHSVALEGKRIGIIGNGSTGVQIVSALAGKVAKLKHFQRTAQWIMPVENGYFSEQERAAFQDPAALEEAMQTELYKASVEQYTQAITDQESEGAKQLAEACLNNLEQSVKDPELRERLRPDHTPLCKRLIFSPDYYQAIQHPNSELLTDGIERIEPQGIRTRDGQLHELDVIVFATGFHADCFMRPMTITGRNGADLEDFWQDHPKAYLAISMPDFPNLFMLNGPCGPIGNFSLIDIAEHQWHYIEQLLARLRSGDCREIAPSHEVMNSYESKRVAAAKETVWFKGGCVSWYLDKNGIPASWPWNFSHFVELMSEPDWQAFGLEAPAQNRAQVAAELT